MSQKLEKTYGYAATIYHVLTPYRIALYIHFKRYAFISIDMEIITLRGTIVQEYRMVSKSQYIRKIHMFEDNGFIPGLSVNLTI
jgi:hypothetical protein